MKSILHTMLSVLLLMGILVVNGPAIQASPNKNTGVEQFYLIAFKNQLPKDYKTMIEKSGGEIIKTMKEIGGVEVMSNNPDFLENIKRNSTVEAVNKEFKMGVSTHKHQQNPQKISLGALSTQEDFWELQWDTQRVTNNGESYDVETGGYQDKNGKIVHKAVVGIIDTGIDPLHPDLKNNIVGGKNLVPEGMDKSETGNPHDIKDRNGHGTHVAGIIAANGNIKGIGPDLGIRVYRAFYSELALTQPAWIIDGIIAATNDHVDVINMSLRIYNPMKLVMEGETYKSLAETLLWKRAIKYAVKNNVVVVAGSGNESLNMDDKNEVNDYLNELYEPFGVKVKGPTTSVPGQLPGVLNVSASVKWSTDELASYSNYGNSAVDVAAPGGDYGSQYASTHNVDTIDPSSLIFSTWPTYLGGPYSYNAGTSMATPQVAGIAAVIKAANPGFKPSQITARINQTALDYGKKGQDALFGSGEANVYNALMNIKK